MPQRSLAPQCCRLDIHAIQDQRQLGPVDLHWQYRLGAHSRLGACNPFNVYAESASHADYARSNRPNRVSGMFSYYGVF